MPDSPLPIAPRTPWFSKFTECLFAGVATLNISMSLIQLLPYTLPFSLGRYAFAVFLLGQIIIAPLFALVYSLIWQSREKRRAINSDRLHAWLQALLRYWLAFTISIYGFGKIFKTQFGVSFSRNDVPIGQLSGFDLTWNYFGHSYVFAVLIAGLQIGGSILLLFRRTTLLGAAILLPVMVNILLINIFYHIVIGAFLNSVLFALGLLYLLALRRAEWIKLFFHQENRLPPIGPGWLKQGARLLAIGGAFAILFSAVSKNPGSPLEGKWTVDLLVRNRDTVGPDAWLANSGAWRTVYIEHSHQLHFCPNPYIYEKARCLDAGFFYNPAKKQLQLFFPGDNSHADTATETVSHYDGSHMHWEGMLGGDTVQLQLSRVGE
ncbi:hypothetical protein [Puia sp.]|uniref:hypothetical protein n=1 Tax=Puia sp. TaxID=2045100 RepID=UPI002F3E375A